MELIFTTIAVVGGMSFSLAVALLVEELIFGKVLGLFFVPRTSQVKAEQ
jgi:antibiotic biosynthesis monooxygenase (ABM) superfamily enzyme